MANRIISFELDSWDYSRWQKRFVSHFDSPEVRWLIHDIYAQLTEKYVPFKTGALNQSVEVTDEAITWGDWYGFVHYAIYPYRGVRNGKRMHYTTTFHPLARSHWDQAVLKYDMRSFKWRVTNELKKIAEEEGW